MKITKSYLIVLLLTAAVFAGTYYLPETANVPVMDGTVDSAEWSDALTVSMVLPDTVNNDDGTLVVGNLSTPASDISGEWYMKWDSQNLYIACVVLDENLDLNNPAPGPFNGQDCVQFAFNPGNDQSAIYLQDAFVYDIAPETSDSAGAWIYKHDGNRSYDPNSVIVTSSTDASGYTVECSLPWQWLGIRGLAGDEIGFGLLLVDFDGSTGVETLFTDFGNGQSGVIGNPQMWNTMYLVDSSGCGSLGRYPGDLNGDCYVTLKDFALIADSWMVCSDPSIEGCIDAR
jgi:hypothetical protein